MLPSPASRLSRITSVRRVRLSIHFASLHYIAYTLPGKPVEHAFAKELLAGFAAAEVDKLAETKGEDFVDREKAKREAKRNAESKSPSISSLKES